MLYIAVDLAVVLGTLPALVPYFPNILDNEIRAGSIHPFSTKSTIQVHTTEDLWSGTCCQRRHELHI